ncbi:MAG: Bro-N domain-containing protein [Synergistaceae bacterium]|nr:Bro-N domain-containing protein [Synergistaceae bacterium]
MSNIQVFNYMGNNEVRVIEGQDGEFWFVAKDVCDILGLANSRDAINVLDDDEKADVGISDGSQIRHMNTISESGLYTLIMRSNKPEAKTFRKWVTGTVLPSIRKTGTYTTPQAAEEIQEKSEPKLKHLSRGNFRTVSKIFDLVFDHKGDNLDEAEIKKVLALDRIFKATTGASALEIAGIELNSEMKLARRSMMTSGGEWDDWILTPEFKYSWKSSLIDDYFRGSIKDSTEF